MLLGCFVLQVGEAGFEPATLLDLSYDEVPVRVGPWPFRGHRMRHSIWLSLVRLLARDVRLTRFYACPLHTAGSPFPHLGSNSPTSTPWSYSVDLLNQLHRFTGSGSTLLASNAAADLPVYPHPTEATARGRKTGACMSGLIERGLVGSAPLAGSLRFILSLHPCPDGRKRPRWNMKVGPHAAPCFSCFQIADRECTTSCSTRQGFT